MIKSFSLLIFFYTSLFSTSATHIILNTNFYINGTTSDDIWLIYKTYFKPIKSLTIITLQTDKHQAEVRQFREKIFQKLSTTPNHTFKIDERFINSTPKSQQRDNQEGIFIHAWDVDVIESFIKTDYNQVVPNAKAKYVISTSFQKNHQGDDVFTGLLRRLWDDYNTAEVFATSFHYNETKIYTYNPFILVNNSWGFVYSCSVQEVLKNFSLITISYSNFNQYPLKISAFVLVPFMFKELPKSLRTNHIYKDLNQSIGFGGSEGFTLAELAKKLNFHPIIIENFEEEPFGRVLPNGTATGTLNDVIKGEVHLSANTRFLKYYGTEKIEYSVHSSSDQLCLVVPKAVRIPIWKMLLSCFSRTLWILIFFSWCTYTFFWYFLRKGRSLSESLWESFSAMFGIPARLKPSSTQFIFLAFGFFFNIIIIGTIQGVFFTEFTTIKYYKDINTLEEMYRSELPIATNAWFLVEDDKSDIMRRLKTRRIPGKGNLLEQTAYERTAATLDRRTDLELLIKSKYRNSYGTPLLHTVDQCLQDYLLVNIVPKNSPFLDSFNEIISRLFQGGFMRKWSNDVIDAFVLEAKNDLKQTERSSTIYDMQAAFRVLIIGYCFSFLVFFGEIIKKYKFDFM